MSDVYAPPFSGITTPSGLTSTDRVRITDRITLLLNIIPDNTNTSGAKAVTYAPDFDNMPPAAAARIRAELTAFYNAVNSAPTNTAIT